MQRRDLLTVIATTTTAGGLAGCLSTVVDASFESGGGSSDPDADGVNGSDDESTELDVELEPPFETDADEPLERYVVGDIEERPDRAPDHVVFVRNAADDERSITFAVSADDDALERSEALPAGEYLEIVVADPAPAEVVVESDGAMARTVTGSSDGGCSLTVVTIGDGVRTETRSTSNSC